MSQAQALAGLARDALPVQVKLRENTTSSPRSAKAGVATSFRPRPIPRAADRPVRHPPRATSHELYRNRNGFVDPGPGLAEPQEMPRNGRTDQAALGIEPPARSARAR